MFFGGNFKICLLLVWYCLMYFFRFMVRERRESRYGMFVVLWEGRVELVKVVDSNVICGKKRDFNGV